MAMPGRDERAVAGRDCQRRRGRHSSQKIEPGGVGALIGRQRQILAVGQARNPHFDVARFLAKIRRHRIGNSRDQPGRHLVFALRRPGFNAGRAHQRDCVAVAAHHARMRRNIVGQNPVAAFAGELCLGICSDILGFRGKADDQFWPLGFRFAMVARMSGFSTSDSSGVGLPACFLSFCSPAFATRQSATAAANIAISAGNARSTACSISRAVSTLIDFNARRVGHIHRATHQRYIRTGRGCGGGNGVTLLAR